MYISAHTHTQYISIFKFAYSLTPRRTTSQDFARVSEPSLESTKTLVFLHRYGISSIKPSKIPPPARKSCSEHASKLLCVQKGCSGSAQELQKAAPAELLSRQKVEKAAPAVLRSCPEAESTFLHRVRRHSALENTNQRDFGATSRSKLIQNHVRRYGSKMLGSAPLHSVSLNSVAPFSVHVYARFTLVYIYSIT